MLRPTVRLLTLASFILIAFSPLSAQAEKRMALVIGNSNYSKAPLPNAANDARLMANTLKAQQFEVFSYFDAGQKDMKRAVSTFTAALKQSGKDTVALVYYAGHGVQVKGENYLIPADANIEKEADVDIESVGVSAMMSALEHTETRLNIIVLDACRTNPFGYSRSAERGLARIDAPTGSIVAFSTAPGKAAQDGDGGNSPYTSALVGRLWRAGAQDRGSVQAGAHVGDRDDPRRADAMGIHLADGRLLSRGHAVATGKQSAAQLAALEGRAQERREAEWAKARGRHQAPRAGRRAAREQISRLP